MGRRERAVLKIHEEDQIVVRCLLSDSIIAGYRTGSALQKSKTKQQLKNWSSVLHFARSLVKVSPVPCRAAGLGCVPIFCPAGEFSDYTGTSQPQRTFARKERKALDLSDCISDAVAGSVVCQTNTQFNTEWTMEPVTFEKLATLIPLTLLCAIFGEVCTAVSVDMTQTNIVVVEGHTAVLPAGYHAVSTDLSKNTVVWTTDSLRYKQIISYSGGQQSQGDPRVGFMHTMPSSNVSIYINNTKESDSGRYSYNVVIPGQTGFSGGINLTVHVPPSVPVCSMRGEAVIKDNVTLSCQSRSGKPIPVYSWEKKAPTTQVFFPPIQDSRSGTLQLTNLTKQMSGMYVCTSSNSAGNESCYINLEVSEPVNAGMIAGVVVGTLLGVLAIILAVYIFLKLRRHSGEDMANEIKEDAPAPRRVSWSKSGAGSDIVSRNGTLSSITTSATHTRGPGHPQHHYPPKPASDTTSIVTTAGSTIGYRPGLYLPRGGEPSYNHNIHERGQPGPASEPTANGNSAPWTDGAQPQAPRPAVVTGVSSSNIMRMGGIPVMVPAQNQAGSLV
ncbi:endothelial cell-selective adhesion molecule-like [Acipenser ruthenus]|nr:endothelial cell-selective adhesion molecule-like [Acipenser ruthenus]